MGWIGKLGLAAGCAGAVLIAVGVTGMFMWPFPGWAVPAFVAGMTVLAPGLIATAFAHHDAMFRKAMSRHGEQTGGLLGMVRSLAGGDPGLLTAGLPATALVVSMKDSGMTVNDMPLVGFELEVRREGADAYAVAHRETVPRLLVGAVLPGTLLAVRLDPADQLRLAVDWSVPPRQGETPVRERLSAAELLARGLPGIATVLGTFSLNGMEADNGDPILGLQLEVTPESGRMPYQVRIGHRVPLALVRLTVPGTRLPVRIAGEDPEKVAIDWTAAETAGPHSGLW
ncbi:hypothetical protein Misp01_07790 [Microtetraspora sp. NBRC 13810]|uniref:hypothetical protein n=1 Tax=Microtetraspora sp. NBRC 13810 TaxID=3030990 RepID=UPI0024A3C91F|nr:hypothetical protein [Microtetraspora sp. NBRC 13810]GLW05649.1 hypothetical protein Misp01_07790 [Microtetraspora sp. NBRC 13810]